MSVDIPNPVKDVINWKTEVDTPISTMSDLFKGIKDYSNDWNNGIGGIMDDFLGWIKDWFSGDKENWLLASILSLFTKNTGEIKELRTEIEHANEFMWLEWVQGSAEKFEGFIDRYSSKYNIPEWKLVKLVGKEGSEWYTWAGVRSPNGKLISSAFWLGMIIKSTWNDLRGKILTRDGVDIWEHGNIDPEMQIYAMAEYLSQMSKIWWWDDAMAYYNTWPWAKNISQEQALKNASINPIISNRIPWVTVEGGEILKWKELINSLSYFAAAKSYYNDTLYIDINGTPYTEPNTTHWDKTILS